MEVISELTRTSASRISSLRSANSRLAFFSALLTVSAIVDQKELIIVVEGRHIFVDGFQHANFGAVLQQRHQESSGDGNRLLRRHSGQRCG